MAEQRIDVSASQVIALRECKTKFELDSLHLKSKNSDKLMLSSRAFNAVKSALQNGEDMKEALMQFANAQITREWYDFDFSYEAAKERTVFLYTRLGYFLKNALGDDVASFNVFLSYPFGINYFKVPIDNINVVADVIVKREDCIEAILLSSGASHLSQSARKIENLPENDLEISIVYAAMRSLYPDETIKVSKYFLLSKDDKGTSYAEYEAKPGKNIASASFDTCVDALSHLKSVMCFKMEKSCSDCHERDCCQFSTHFQEKEEVVASDSHTFEMTAAQKQIVEHIDGPMLVEAAPGTGKTASLVNRLKHMVDNGVDAKSILMITFTKKARAEIEKRVSNLLGEGAELPTIQTFNGCGYDILRDNPKNLGELRLAEDFDKKALVEQALKDCVSEGIIIKNVNYSNMTGAYGLVQTTFDYIDKIDNYGRERFVEMYSSKKDVQGYLAVYDKYQQLFDEGNFISYDEQVTLVNKLFEDNSILNAYQEKWKYIMVDEFQDVSLPQFNMIYALSEKYRNIVCVGDCDQAIYSFRGGSNKFALEFKEYYPEAKLVYMVDNFRCTDTIVAAANSLIKNNRDRYDKTIIAHKNGKPVLLYRDCPNGENTIYNNLLNEGYAPGDIAVIATTNKALAHFGNVIAPDGSLTPKDYVINDSVFLALKDIIELKECGFDNDRILYRVLVAAGASREDFLNLKRDRNVPLYCCKDLPDMTLKPLDEHYDTPLWRAGLKVKAAMREFVYAGDIEHILSNVCKDIFGFSDHPVVNYLVEKCDERCINKTKPLLALMNSMILYGDSARVGYGESSNRVNLITAHDSKGKEFPCVVIYGAENFKNDEEGRRLLYVALTRAKKRLVVIEGFRNPDSMVNEFSADCREDVLQERRRIGL